MCIPAKVSLLIIATGIPAQTPASSPPDYSFAYKVIHVEQHWDKFVRKYFGCPAKGATTVNECNFQRSQFDKEQLDEYFKAVDELRR